VRRIGAFGAAQVATDVAIVTALVAFTGGVESIFGFLYVPITVSAALLLGRRGAYAASALAALAYGSLIILPSFGVLGASPATGSLPIQLALFGVHAGALLLVALLASALSHERDRAGDALDQRTRALRHLQRLHERTVESLTSGLLTTDSMGRITTFNPEAERITGRPAAEVLGRMLGEVIPEAPEFVHRGIAQGARADLRHLHVHQHQVVRQAVHRLDGFDAIGGDIGAIPHRFEQQEGELLVHGVVLGEKDAEGMALAELGDRVFVDGRPLDGPAAQQRHQQVEELRLLHRFGEDGSEHRIDLAAAERRVQHQRQLGPQRAQPMRELDAVHAGHVHVEDRQVERIAALDHRQRLVARL
jgi:PAS domain S-box-containing protein